MKRNTKIAVGIGIGALVLAAVTELDVTLVQGQLDEDYHLSGSQAPRHDAGNGG
jgi:hypothetical protein